MHWYLIENRFGSVSSTAFIFKLSDRIAGGRLASPGAVFCYITTLAWDVIRSVWIWLYFELYCVKFEIDAFEEHLVSGRKAGAKDQNTGAVPGAESPTARLLVRLSIRRMWQWRM